MPQSIGHVRVRVQRDLHEYDHGAARVHGVWAGLGRGRLAARVLHQRVDLFTIECRQGLCRGLVGIEDIDVAQVDRTAGKVSHEQLVCQQRTAATLIGGGFEGHAQLHLGRHLPVSEGARRSHHGCRQIENPRERAKVLHCFDSRGSGYRSCDLQEVCLLNRSEFQQGKGP
jgi:hypothetical protein